MNRILIFSSARSGGNLLDGQFERYDGVSSFGEAFSRRHFSHRKEDVLHSKDIHTISNSELITRLDASQKDIHTSTYRVHNIHFNYSFNKNLLDEISPYKKIILYRESFLDKSVSLDIARHTRQWHYTDKSQVIDYSDYKIYFNPASRYAYLVELTNYYNHLFKLYPNSIVIKYEDLIEMDNIDNIIDKLNLNLKFKGGDIPTTYINPNRDNYKYIINYDELIKLSSFKLKFDGTQFNCSKFK